MRLVVCAWIVAIASGCSTPAPAPAAAVVHKEPWEPADEGFRGCEGG